MNTKKRFRITCLQKPWIALVITKEKTPEDGLCLICHSTQKPKDKNNCMAVEILRNTQLPEFEHCKTNIHGTKSHHERTFAKARAELKSS